MHASSDHETLFLSELARIERIIAATCRRHRLQPQDREDAASFIKLQLIQGDYAIIRKFENRSSLATFLATVIQRLFMDYQTSRWGKWRPSAEARRRGPLAMRLESLVHRDRMPVEQAIEVLRTNFQVQENPEVLRRLAAELPTRIDRRAAASSAGPAEAVASDAEAALRRAEGQRQAGRLGAALASVMAELAPQDRLVFKLRYVDSFSVAEIARRLRLDPFPLYRRIEQGHRRLRRELEAQGVLAEDVREWLAEAE